MSEEQNEVLEQQRYLLERRMYRLDPAPPKLPAQEYIVRYLIEKKDKYLTWYLHDQEPALNKLAQATCERYAMAEHFADIKQAAVCGILVALQKYDPAIGAPFAAFQKRYIQDGIDDYIRTAQSGVITMTADTYPVLRRIMAIYHLNGDDCSDSCIQRIADETGMHEHHPGAKLISVSNNNSSGAEAAETGCVDYFINARELYRIIMRTGGRPSVKRPIEAEEIAEFEKCGRYAELFEAGGWYVDKPAEELEFTENGKRYKALICHNLGQVKAAVAKLDKYDVIKITA